MIKLSPRILAAVVLWTGLAFAPRFLAAEGTHPACGNCPTIKPVNTSEHPAKGHVKDELDRSDLQTIFSNRDSVYGSWEDGDAALRSAIDPDGSLHVNNGAAIFPRTTDTKLVEGWASKEWINGPPPSGPFMAGRALPGQLPHLPLVKTGNANKHLPPPKERKNGLPYSNLPGVKFSHTSGFTVAAPLMTDANSMFFPLLDTIARCNKYGEPAAGIRIAAVRLVRIMLDLGSVPYQPPAGTDSGVRLYSPYGSTPGPRLIRPGSINTHDRKYWLYNEGQESRRWLWEALDAEWGQYHGGKTKEKKSKKGSLDLSRVDVANAAMDVILSNDEKGRITPDLSLRARTIAGRAVAQVNVLSVLIELASESPKFGGRAKANSPQDALACKAYEALVKLLDAKADDQIAGRAARKAVLEQMASLLFPRKDQLYLGDVFHQQALAARQALLQTGFASADEAREAGYFLAIRYFALFDFASGKEKQEDFFRETIKSFTAEAGGSNGNPYGTNFAETINRFVHSLEQTKPEYRSKIDEAFLQHWNAQGAVVSLQPPGQSCPPETCEASIESETPYAGPEDFKSVAALEIHQNLKGSATIPSLDSVYETEPFYFVLRIPPKDSAANSPSLQVHLKARVPAWKKAHLFGAPSETTITLKNRGEGPDHRILFVTVKPFTLKKGGDGGSPIEAQNGTAIDATYGNQGIEFNAYDDDNEQAIGRSYSSIINLQTFYNVLLQNPKTPDEAKGPNGWIRRKLRACANALYILTYQPPNENSYHLTKLAQGLIGESYLKFLQGDPRNWDTDSHCYHVLGYPDLPKQATVYMGPDKRFGSFVVYGSCDEAEYVERAILDAEAQQTEAAYRALINLNILLVNFTIQSSCFETVGAVTGQVISNEICNQDFVGLLLGQTPEEEDLDLSDKFLQFAGNHLPLIIHGGQLALELKPNFGSSGSFINNEFNIPEEDRLGGLRSEDLNLVTDASEIATVEDKFGTTDVTYRIDQHASLPGATLSAPPRNLPAGLLARLGSARVSSGKSFGGFMLQIANNTCGFSTAEMARLLGRAGATVRSEAARVTRAMQLSMEQAWLNIASVWRDQNGVVPGIYEPGDGTPNNPGGMNVAGWSYYMERDGAFVWNPPQLGIRDMISNLRRGRQICIAVNVAPPGQAPVWHDTMVMDIFQDRRGRWFVKYGDPANGNFWDVSACTYASRMKPGSIRVVIWP